MEHKIKLKISNPPPTRNKEGSAHHDLNYTATIHVGPFQLEVNAQDLVSALSNRDRPSAVVECSIK